MTLRGIHRTSAILLSAFACLHIANHLASLSSVAAHIAFMDAARSIYRHSVIEIALLLSVVIQIASGVRLVLRDWKQRRGVAPWIQAISGGYLAFFLLVHVGAVLFGRAVLKLDTNFYFAAAGFSVPPFQLFFAPYYFLGVLAVFTHLGCAAYRRLHAPSRRVRSLVAALPVLVGAVVSLLLVLVLSGTFRRVEIPAQYRAVYAR